MKKKIMVTAAMTAVMALSLAGCGVKVTNISIPEEVTMERGDSITLPINFGTDKAPAETPLIATGESATAETADADTKIAKAAEKLSVEWTSSDESIATVDENGLVTAVGPGDVSIFATVADSDMQDACVITVEVTAKELNVASTLDICLNNTDTGKVDAKVTPSDATDISLNYATSDESVATVDTEGTVTAVKPGECDVITTLTQKGDKVAEKTTHVKVFFKVDSIKLDSKEGKLAVGASHTIKATVAPAEVAAETPITWKSSDEKVATVDSNGKVTGVASGNATITATAGEESATYDVTVEEAKKNTTTNSGSKNTTSGNKTTASGKNNTASSSTGSGSSSAGNTPNSGSSAAPSAPAPVVTPEPAPVVTPAPAPDPTPEPAPAEPSQPSGGNEGTVPGTVAPSDPSQGWEWGGPVISSPIDNGCSEEEHAAALC